MADGFSLTGFDEPTAAKQSQKVTYLGKEAIDESNVEIDVSALTESGWLMYSIYVDDDDTLHAAFVQAGAESVFKGRVPVLVMHVGNGDAASQTRDAVMSLADRNSGDALTAIGGEELIGILGYAMEADALGIADKSLTNTQFVGFNLFL